MGKALSNDLRERMVYAANDGQSCREIASRFGVAPSTAVRVTARYRATGSVAPKRQGRPAGGGKLPPHRDFIIAQVEAKPDITMPELAQVLLNERGVQADPSSLSRVLCNYGFSYKKNTSGIRARAC